MSSTPEELDEYCSKADFVFNLAGVNRLENPEDFMKGNLGFASQLLDCLRRCIELIQYIAVLGYCEADDVLNNTIGTVVGCLMATLY